MKTEYGLLLPHFGAGCDKDKVIEGSKKAEALGFDSVFVRDHLVFHPHGMEGTDNTFIDPFVTLAAVGAVTSRIQLGFGSLIPHRHPLLLALMINSLEYMVGERLILTLGIGNFQVEFDAIGMNGWPRDEVAAEQVEIVRKSWTHDHFAHEGKYYKNADIGFKPRVAKPLPIWYAGATPASVRRALAFCDGWFPGRITVKTYQKRVEKLRSEAAAQGRPRLLEGCIPITSIDVDRETALKKVNVAGLLKNANEQKFWVKPESGSFQKWEDLEGSFIVGDPDDVVNETKKFLDIGIDHIVFDLRFRFDDWDRCLELLAKDVVPKLRKYSA
jgi:alkanesulfonate monooxygenase SsuD/methylene tetrahydromethanopterin reductase-like flavin-dependent oxidoreductase (luciferase family)